MNTQTDPTLPTYDVAAMIGAMGLPEPKPGGRLFRGFTPECDWLSLAVPEGFELHEVAVERTYRAMWSHAGERAILTYVEGDVTLEIYDTDKDFERALNQSIRFYMEN